MPRTPSMKAVSVQDFLDSTEGQRTIWFLNEYLFLNAEIRRRRLQGLRINYDSVTRTRAPGKRKLLRIIARRWFGRKHIPTSWRDWQVIARRMFAVEIISQTLMSIEDLGAFCQAFQKPLEDVPSSVIGYRHSDISKFYDGDWTPGYLSDLLLLPDPQAVVCDEWLRQTIAKIQDHNIEAFQFFFRKIAEYRQMFGRLYNKSKHGNPVLYRHTLSRASPGLDVEAVADTIFVLDSKDRPFEEFAGYIVGRDTVEKSTLIMRRVSDILVTLIHRYLEYLKFQGNYPPLFVFGENPLPREEWTQYKKAIQNLLPSPRQLVSREPTAHVDAASVLQWLESPDWSSKWFRQKEWEYQEGSKITKHY